MSSQLEVVYKDLKNEHRRVMDRIERLRAHETETGLLPLLEKLRTLLIVHFAREQLPDGFYDALGERAQRRMDEIRILTADHAAILSTLNVLIEDVESLDVGSDTGPDADGGADVLERTRRLADQVQDHENREHRFAAEVLGVEPDA